VIYGAGRALQKFLVALLLPLYTAFLSRGDYGILGMVITVTTFLDVFITLGFDVAFSRFYFDDKSAAARTNVITNVFYVSTVYPALVLGALAALMPRLAPLIMGAEYSPGDWVYFDIALLTLFFTNLNDVPFTLFRLEHRPWRFSAYTVGRVLIQVPLSIVFVAVFRWGPMGVLLANLITAGGMQASLLPTYIRKVDWRFHRDLMQGMLAFAIPALFTGISFYWLKLSDRYFLLHYQGKEEVGLYTVANSLAQPLYLVLMAFRMAWPQWHYARLHEPEAHKRMVARSSTYFIALNGAALVLLGALLPLLVHVFLDRKFWSVGPTTFVLGLSIVLYALYFIFWVGANVAKRNRLIPAFFAVASAVNIVLNFWLVPPYGMWAAAWTTVAGYVILAVTVYFYSRKWYAIPYEWRRLLLVLLATSASLAAVWGLGQALSQSVYSSISELALDTLLTTPAVLLFPLLLWITGFLTARERQQLTSLVRRLGGGRRPPELAVADAAEGAVAAPEITGGARLSADELAAEDDELALEAEAGLDITEGRSDQL
jgi:O-antigen/teichoic acid export membrane protein